MIYLQKDQKQSAFSVVFRFVRSNLWLFGLGLLCSVLNTAFNSLTPQIIRLTVDSIIGSGELPAWLENLGVGQMAARRSCKNAFISCSCSVDYSNFVGNF